MIKKIIGYFLKNTTLKAGFFYTVGNFFVAGINFITLPIFTRILNTSDFGIYSLYSTWLGIFTVVLSLNLVASVSRGKFDYKENFNNFLSSVMFLATITYLLFMAVVLTFGSHLTQLFSLPPKLLPVLLTQSFFDFVFLFFGTRLTIMYKYKKFFFLSLTTSVLKIILSLVFIFLLSNQRYLGRIYGGFLVSIIIGTALYLSIFLKGKSFVNISYWKYALAISLPLIPHSISGLMLVQFDRILINKYIGPSETGIYSFAYNIGMILNIIWTSLNNAWVPWFFDKMVKKDYTEINRKAKYYIMLFSGITFLLIFVSPEMIHALAPPKYWAGGSLVTIILISYYFAFLYSLPSNIEFFEKKTHFISLGTLISAGINIFLNYLLIPRMGYTIAAWTTVISYFSLFLFHYIIVTYILKKRIFKLRYFIYGTLFIVITGLTFVLIKDYLIIRYIIIFITFFIVLKTASKLNITKTVKTKGTA